MVVRALMARPVRLQLHFPLVPQAGEVGLQLPLQLDLLATEGRLMHPVPQQWTHARFHATTLLREGLLANSYTLKCQVIECCNVVEAEACSNAYQALAEAIIRCTGCTKCSRWNAVRPCRKRLWHIARRHYA